jgi:hypothetical protein
VVSIYVCRICKETTITVMTRTQYYARCNHLVKDRMCLPCWKDLLDLAEAVHAMNGHGA